MEYRKRQRRVQKRRIRQDSYAGTVFCVVLLFAAIVYLIGVSSAGTWMAKSVIAPVFRTLGIISETGSANQSDTESQYVSSSMQAPVTDSIRIGATTYYALQMGVYSNSDNAAKQAASLQAMGAGGYIVQEDGKYRVLAACYPTDTDLNSVRKRLSEEGMESSAYLLRYSDVEYLITADEEEVSKLRESIDQFLMLIDRTYALIYAFDSEKQDISIAKNALNLMLTDLENQITALSEISEHNEISNRLLRAYKALQSAMKEAMSYDGDQQTVFTGKLKYLHLYIADTVRNFIKDTVELT